MPVETCTSVSEHTHQSFKVAKFMSNFKDITKDVMKIAQRKLSLRQSIGTWDSFKEAVELVLYNKLVGHHFANAVKLHAKLFGKHGTLFVL